MTTTLFENKYLAVLDTDGYIYARDVRAAGQIVSLLPYRRVATNTESSWEYLAHIEVCPAHGQEPSPYSITGGVGELSVIETAAMELWEEAGYRAQPDDFIPLGVMRPAKNLDTYAHLFAINVTDKEGHTPPTDDSPLEQIAYPKWLTRQASLTVQDPLFLSALLLLTDRGHT